MNIRLIRQSMEALALRLRHEEENGATRSISDPLRVALSNMASDIALEMIRMKGGKDVKQ